MAKKIAAIILALALVLPFAACDGGGESGKNAGLQNGQAENGEYGETAKTEDPEGKDDLPEKDFGGAEFVILVDPDTSFRHFYDVCVEEMEGELIHDAVYTRNLEIEERFNVKISDIQNNNVFEAIRKSVAADSVDYCVAWAMVGDYVRLSQSNMLIDLQNVPELNLGKKYWDQNVVRDFTISGKLYGIMGDISTSVSVFTHLFAVNKVMAQNNGIDIAGIYQMVRDGKWTYDALYSLAKDLYRDLDGDGTPNYADQYGFGVTTAVVDAMFSASGEKLVTRDGNGDFILTPVTARIEAVFNKIGDILSDKTLTSSNWNIGKIEGEILGTGRGGAGWYSIDHKFFNNTVLFVDIDVGIMMDFRSMDSDFGVVPVPKFDESQKNYSVYAYPLYAMLTIPSTYGGDAKALDMIGTVMEGLASASYKHLTPAFYDTAFATKYTRDEESIEMLDIVLRSRIYDWMTIFNFGNIYQSIHSQVEKNSLNIVSLFEKNEAKAQSDIQKLMESYAEND
ncbi:MAG: extracellular solute-binding protein [Oscillospiraceae bacterium]|nr:extracellular solute-binding protein [Oscillospiraceae bacterium]